MNLKADDSRVGPGNHQSTGIYVRATSGNSVQYASFDIAELDAESLLVWLRSRGGDNPLAEDVVGILLGHGHLHKLTKGD